MNLYDLANINRISGQCESQIPGIKIVDGGKSIAAVGEFRNDLKNCRVHDEVDRVLLRSGNLVGIILKNSRMPIVYYFTDSFDAVGEVLDEFRKVCDELDITFQELC